MLPMSGSFLLKCSQQKISIALALRSFVQTEAKDLCGWPLHCKRFLWFSDDLSVQSCVRPVYVALPLAMMSSASKVPIGSTTSEGLDLRRSVLAFG